MGDLLRIGHMYQVDDLQRDCTEYLKGNISENQKALELLEAACTLDNPDLEEASVKFLQDKITDGNVMSFWKVAARCGNEIIYSKAIQHLLERPESKVIKDVPGFIDEFQSQEKMMDLLEASVEALKKKLENLKIAAEEKQERNQKIIGLNDKLKRFIGMIKIAKSNMHDSDNKYMAAANGVLELKAKLQDSDNKYREAAKEVLELKAKLAVKAEPSQAYGQYLVQGPRTPPYQVPPRLGLRITLNSLNPLSVVSMQHFLPLQTRRRPVNCIFVSYKKSRARGQGVAYNVWQQTHYRQEELA